MDYAEFLARKALRVEAVGFEARPFSVDLFPFQRDIVALACKLGRFCIWAGNVNKLRRRYPDGFIVGGGVR